MSLQILQAIHTSTGASWSCEYDPHFFTGAFFRMKGLLGRSEMKPRTAIWLKPCNAIHMLFMKFPIDVAFLDRELRVVKIYRAIQPWRVTPIISSAHSCLEMPAGEAASILEGDFFSIKKHEGIEPPCFECPD